MATIDEYLRRARSGLTRIEPESLWSQVAGGALLVDTRPLEQRQRDGELPGALVVGLNVLEWRLSPSSPSKTVDVAPSDLVILVCDQGYSSSLAAARLQELGLAGATDLVGGFQALIAAGLAVPPASAES